MMQNNFASENLNRGGSSEGEVKLFGIQCDFDFGDSIAQCLNAHGAETYSDSDSDFVYGNFGLGFMNELSIQELVDKKFGQGVTRCLSTLGIQLNSALVCGCGNLGHRGLVGCSHLVCEEPTDQCFENHSQPAYQSLQPNVVARSVAEITGYTSLGTDIAFITMLGALAGYPFSCACGNPVTCLDAPFMSCDFCIASEGVSEFIKHMDAAGPVADRERKYSMLDNILSGISGGFAKLHEKTTETGSYVYGLISQLITTVGNYFNSVFQHYGSEFFDGMKNGFNDTMRKMGKALKDALGSDGFLFLIVGAICAVIVRFGIDLVANFIISSTLSLLNMLKDVGGKLFTRFTETYTVIVERLRAGKESDDAFVKHSGNTDGCVSMIATLFCTFATASGVTSGANVLRSIASARHVASGMLVAKSALLWFVEKMPTALQTYLWDVTGVGSFECKDDELKQIIVVMRESLLSLRSTPVKFLNDEGSCKLLLTAHTMLTRAVTRNTHGWNATQNSILRAMLAEAKDYIPRAQACVDRGIGRIEPLGIILQGDPGIGKTALIEALAARLNPEVPRAARLYFKNLLERFWSGYSEQPVIVLDDYGAIKDESKETGIAADLLRIIGPGDMALETPFGDKGAAFCKSTLVVMTTNRDMNVPQKFLESNKAFMRRFLYLTVEIIESYRDANGLLNVALLKSLPIEQALTFPHLRFRIHTDFKVEGDGRAGLFNLSTVDRTFEEVLTVINAKLLLKQRNAQFLQDASVAAAPPPDKTNELSRLEANIAQSVVEEDIRVLHDDPIQNILSYVDGVATDDKLPIDEDEKFDMHMASDEKPLTGVTRGDSLPIAGQSSSAFGALAREMVDHIESPSMSVVNELKKGSEVKESLPKTSGGNRLGTKARAAYRSARQHVKKTGEKINEFGLDWHDDCVVRAQAFIDSCSQPTYKATQSMRAQTEKFKEVMTATTLEVMGKIKHSPFKFLASVAACAGTIALCIRAYQVFTDSTHEPQMRSKYDSDHTRRRPNIAYDRRFAPSLTKHIDHESDTDRGVIAKVAANTGYLERAGGKVGCFFIKGTVFRTVTHFFRTGETEDKWLPDGTPFSVFARQGDQMVEYKMSFSWDFVLPFEDEKGLMSDWLYYSCGTKVPPKKDMTHMHIDQRHFAHRRDFGSVLMVRPDSVSRGNTSVVQSLKSSHAVQYSSLVPSELRPDVYVPTAIFSDYSCQHGDCGFPVLGRYDGQYKILSMHVGERSRAVSTDSTSAVVSLSEVNMCLDHLDARFPIVMEKHCFTDITQARPGVDLNDSYAYLGRLDWAPAGVSCKTKYEKSPIYDYIEKEIVYEPSIMGDKNDSRTTKSPKQVLADIANRADSSLAVMPKHLVMMAGDALFESIITQIPATDDTFIRTLTLDEALNGDGKFVDTYPTAGSPGIPCTLNRKHGVKGKHGIMSQGPDDRWFISDEDCQKRVDELHEGFSRGEIGFAVNQFCMKDETLKRDSEGNLKKTRGVKCAPFESNICGKRYFGGMVCLFKQFFHCIPFKCGMNVFSSDWDDFIKWHLEVGDMGFDGDIGGQENIIKGEIYDELYRFTDRIYAHYGDQPTAEERRQRASYLTSLCHYYMVIGPDLFRAKFGNPSGNWLTSFICSFTSGILLGVAYFGLALQHDPLKANIYNLNTLVRMSLSGDDNFVSRSSLLNWFTGANVSEYLLTSFGYKYTDAQKAAVFPPDRKVVKLNFLACDTRETDEYPGIRYMACIGDGPLAKCAQYVSKKAAGGDRYIAIADNVNTALDMVWTSGRERFESYRAKYYAAFVRTPNCRVPNLHDFAFCEERFLRKELLTEDYTCDDYLFVPQIEKTVQFIPHMLKSPEQVEPEFDKAQVNVEAGPEGSADSTVTYQCTERTVLDVQKRFSVSYYSNGVTSPAPSYCESASAAFLLRAPVTGDMRPMAGTLAYFAGPFAAWSGDLRVAVKSAADLLIRTDATERLANAAAPNIPTQITKGISSMAPFDYTSARNQWALMQIPSSIPRKFSILPKISGEEKYQETTTASIIVDTPQGVDRPPLTVLTAAGDNFTEHFLFMVPSLLIKSNSTYYPHNRNWEATLPEYLKLQNVAGATPFPFTQATVIFNFDEMGAVESNGNTVESILYRTEAFQDSVLVSLGVVQNPPVNRRYDPGSVRPVNCDMSKCVARSIDIEVRPGGAVTGAATFNLDDKIAVVRGTSYNSGVIEMAMGWFLTFRGYENATVRSLLNATGIPSTEVVIPCAQSGYEHSPASSYIVPTLNNPTNYVGGEYFVWDPSAQYPKAFYETTTLPFLEERKDSLVKLDLSKDDYTFVKHMDSNSHGIGFSNVVDSQPVTTDRKPRIARKQMGEENYSYGTLVDRFQLIRSFDWDDSQVQGTILDSRTVPFDCIGTTSRDAFGKFCYWSGDMEFKLQVQSTAFVCGKLTVVFAPFCDPARATVLQLSSLVSISAAPNVSIMAGNTTEVMFKVPYAHYKNYLNTDGQAGDPFGLLGTISVVVFNKLRVGQGAVDTKCTVNIYTRFPSSQFQMLRPPPTDGNVGFVKHGGAMSVAKNVTDVIDDVTDAVGKVGAVAGYALDVPNVGVNYTPVFGRAAPMLNHSKQLQYMNVMDLNPGQNSLADQKDVASDVPECSLKYLLTKPTYLNTFTIKGSDLEGQNYMTIPLTPTIKLFNAPATSMIDETLMGYTAAPFKFWRGGFQFIIEVIATSVHTCRLVFATHYGGAASTVSMDNILAQNAEVLEVGAGRNTFRVCVPWRVPLQWLEVPNGPAEPVNAFEVTSAARYTMGEASIRLLTRLQSMQSVTPDIECNVYVSMLDDAELAFVGMNCSDLTPVFAANRKVAPN